MWMKVTTTDKEELLVNVEYFMTIKKNKDSWELRTPEEIVITITQYEIVLENAGRVSFNQAMKHLNGVSELAILK